MLAARSASMSPSSPAGTPDTSLEPQPDTTSKRRISGRVKSKPALLSDDPYLSQASNGVKRKRVELRDEELEILSDDELEGRRSSVDESGPDEEELKEQRSKARRGAKKPAAKKPAAKKSKTTTLAMRPAGNGVKKPARPKKSTTTATGNAGDDETGLYGVCA